MERVIVVKGKPRFNQPVCAIEIGPEEQWNEELIWIREEGSERLRVRYFSLVEARNLWMVLGEVLAVQEKDR